MDPYMLLTCPTANIIYSLNCHMLNITFALILDNIYTRKLALCKANCKDIYMLKCITQTSPIFTHWNTLKYNDTTIFTRHSFRHYSPSKVLNKLLSHKQPYLEFDTKFSAKYIWNVNLYFSSWSFYNSIYQNHIVVPIQNKKFAIHV